MRKPKDGKHAAAEAAYLASRRKGPQGKPRTRSVLRECFDEEAADLHRKNSYVWVGRTCFRADTVALWRRYAESRNGR